jgi:hypothetical protein
MLIVRNETFMLSFIMPNVILLSVIMLTIGGTKNHLYFEYSNRALKEEKSNKKGL